MCFRRLDDLPAVLDDVIAVGASTLWLQFGLWDENIADMGTAAGLTVVMDRCLKIEHARFHGNLRLGGFDTGVIELSPRPAGRHVSGAPCGLGPGLDVGTYYPPERSDVADEMRIRRRAR